MEGTETLLMEKLCRVCLNYGEHMTPLTETQNEPQNLEQNLTISQLLEKVMKIKIVIDEQCPNSICDTCLDILKACHDFQVLFTNSQDCLGQYFNRNVTMMANDEANGVDLMFGSNKFSLDDVVVLEEQADETDYIERLISNLNGAVSIEVVSKTDAAEPENSIKSENVIEVVSGSEADEGMPMEKGGLSENNGINEFYEDPLPYHVTIVTKDDINWNRNQCDLCPAVFFTKDKLMKHFSSQHCALVRNDLCQDCAYAFASNKIEAPKPPSFGDKQPSYAQCTRCRALLKKKHSDRKSYACEICDETYTLRGSLEVHQKTVHRSETIKLCAVCGQSFERLSLLVDHMRTHHEKEDARKFKCSHCPKVFASLSLHKRHLTVHTSVLTYRCSICRAAFFSSDEKQKHELLHWNIKPFACGDCDTSFRTLNERKLHKKKRHLSGGPLG